MRDLQGQDLKHWTGALAPAPVTLRGCYVTLEPLDAARHTAALWQAVESHDELWAWLAQGPYLSATSMVETLERWREAEKAVLFAIIPSHTGPAESPRTGLDARGGAAGWASYMRIKPAPGVIEVGNVLFSPALQRTREATEAMFLMARHVFEHLGYRRYEWKCNAMNEPSRRAAARLGFTFEGIFRQHMVVKGQNRDSAWFSMLDSEWPARKRAFEAWLAPENFDEARKQRRTLEELSPR
jgi:RimJ/RimL family protein N-acetyltransferase